MMWKLALFLLSQLVVGLFAQVTPLTPETPAAAAAAKEEASVKPPVGLLSDTYVKQVQKEQEKDPLAQAIKKLDDEALKSDGGAKMPAPRKGFPDLMTSTEVLESLPTVPEIDEGLVLDDERERQILAADHARDLKPGERLELPGPDPLERAHELIQEMLHTKKEQIKRETAWLDNVKKMLRDWDKRARKVVGHVRKLKHAVKKLTESDKKMAALRNKKRLDEKQKRLGVADVRSVSVDEIHASVEKLYLKHMATSKRSQRKHKKLRSFGGM